MPFKIKYEQLGGHVHCDLYFAPESNQTYAKCGSFVVREGHEFVQIKRDMSGIAFTKKKDIYDGSQELQSRASKDLRSGE